MRLSTFFSLCLLALWLQPGSASADAMGRRVALVVGNGDYGDAATALPNAPNDARALAAELEALGYQVVRAIDQDYRGMRAALARFADALRGADAGLFFYAGHGMEFQGRNYLFPTDAELRNESDVYIGLIEVDQVLRIMETSVPVRLVFLDACRDNPLARRFRGSLGATRSSSVGRGLARVDATVGTFVAYATAPGEVAEDGSGDNSPFTTAMLRHLEVPGLDVSDFMRRVRQSVVEMTDARQTPWESSSLLGSFVLNVEVNITVEPPPPPPAEAAVQSSGQAEIVFWQSIQQSARASDFEAYLARFGDDGIFAPLAKARLAGLVEAAAEDDTPAAVTPEPEQEVAAVEPARSTVAAEPPPTVVTLSEGSPEDREDMLGLSLADWQRLQAGLDALGFDPRGVDGRPGPNTRRAIAAWQAARGSKPSGFLDAGQRRRLESEAEPRLAALEATRPAVGGAAATSFKDCDICPEMVVVPAGSFQLGSPASESSRRAEEGPQRRVCFAEPFAIGRFEVTWRQYSACVSAGACRSPGARAGDLPVEGVGYEDARAYAAWLVRRTGRPYRLPSEAEWEYAARGGTGTAYFWGASSGSGHAVCADCGTRYDFDGPAPVGSFPANAFGLHDMAGNVWEWVADCWNESHEGARSDGTARRDGNCRKRVLKGGSYESRPHVLRSAARKGDFPDGSIGRGFRVMRPLN
ncbi:MAG: SUMF1/EgtB/PvdO family nonheme iron enzyme [Geminicoccaceae bacterium]|nr:SUMF1/EgtB/PvdO family nonheme iron enzyme [Geminicoccaceae bacterium]